MCENSKVVNEDLKSVKSVQNEGPQTAARAPGNANVNDVVGNKFKKRKTRRGKSKRRNLNPYIKLSWQQRKYINNKRFNNKFRLNIANHGQALAPFNSNQFLMEDHGDMQELDDKLNKSNGASSSMVPPRTRDSSFSVDSDGDFYSSPEDEEEFLTKEFDTAYEDLHVERLNALEKSQLVAEVLLLEGKLERSRGKSTVIPNNDENTSLREEMHKLIMENNELRKENERLRKANNQTASSYSSSMDSESDSSSSTCNSSSSSNSAEIKNPSPISFPDPESQSQSVQSINYSETNGLSSHPSSPIGPMGV